MKTRLINLAMVLCLLLSLLSGSAAAAELKHFHPRESFDNAITDTLPQTLEGKVYLSGDVKAQSDISVNSEVTLCLAGFRLDMDAYSINIAPGASLTVYDCPDSSSGVLCSSAQSDKAVIENLGSFILNGGRLSSDKRVMLLNRSEAGIMGGILEGEADLIHTIGSGMLNVNAGQLKAQDTATAVRMISDPADESAKKLDYNVGIAGTAIVSAESGSEGALVVDAPKGRFVLNTGADVRGYGCPAATVLSGTFDVYGAARVSADTDSAIVGRGGTVALYNAVINSENKYGVDIVEEGILHLSGALEINGGLAGIHLADTRLFSMSDYGFYGDVRISMLTDIAPEEGKSVALSMPCDAKNAPHFISANPGCSITYENGVIYNSFDSTVTHHHDGKNFVQFYDGTVSDLARNNYYLQSDVNCAGFFTGSVVNLCLGGHTLKLSTAIKMYPESTLHIFDCTGEGKIEANGVCIQDINNGSTKLVIHGGQIVSHSMNPIKLSGNDTVVIKGGEVKSEVEGSCAIEVIGAGNRVDVNGGSLISVNSAIRAQDCDLTVGGSAEGRIEGGVYAVEMAGLKSAVLSLGGSAVFEGGSADIGLGAEKLLLPLSDLAPAEAYSISNSAAEVSVLSLPAEQDSSMYFSSTVEDKLIVSNENNELILAKSLPISPMEAELFPGETETFTVEYTGELSPSYQWYMRKGETGSATAIEGAVESEYTSPSDLESGVYSFYCVVNDGKDLYYTDNAVLTALKNDIVNVSVKLASPLSYNGSPRTPIIEASASSTLGKPVSFVYSADGKEYSAVVPSLGPGAGEYIIYYIASAEGCEGVKGELNVSIDLATVEQAPPSSKPSGFSLKPSGFNFKLNIDPDIDARLAAIVVLMGAVVLLSIIYTIVQLHKLMKKDND